MYVIEIEHRQKVIERHLAGTEKQAASMFLMLLAQNMLSHKRLVLVCENAEGQNVWYAEV